MLAYSSHRYMKFEGKCFSLVSFLDYLLLLSSFVYECVFGYTYLLQLFLKDPLSTFTSLPLDFIFPFLFTSATRGKDRDGHNF